MVEQNKNVFLQALIFAVVIFAIGIVIGSVIEGRRVDKIELALLNSEISSFDEQIRQEGISVFNLSCESSIQSTFLFADRIFSEARLLEDYDSSSNLGSELKIIHKKYDLLRMLLWSKSVELKEDCPQEFHTVVYLFEYEPEEVEKEARQNSVSSVLVGLKEEYGSDILLIPIATNLDLESVNLVLNKFGVSDTPAIIVDEKKVVREDVTAEELRDIVFESNNFEELKGNVYQEISFDERKLVI